MKKTLILAAVAAVALSACSKNEFIPTVEESTRELSFGTYSPRSITKADADNYVSGNTLIADADFDVWGWYTANGTSFNGTNGTDFFGNPASWYTVTYKSGGNSDGTKNAYPDGARYWPTGDTPNYLHFAAYYPSNGSGITPPASGLGAYSFTAQDAAVNMVDFMVADVVKDQTYNDDNGNPGTNSGTDGTVALNFRHMLTRVQFKFKTTQAIVDDANTTIKVTDAKIYNALTTGTLTSSYRLKDNSGNYYGEVGYDATNIPLTGETSTVWSGQALAATPIVYDVFVNGADISNFELTATAAPATNNAADIFLMVPQDMITPEFQDGKPHIPANLSPSSKPQYLVVEWDVITKGVTTHNSRALYFDTDLKTTDNITAPAAAMDLDWAKNASITYTITIGPKQILFTGAATAWDSETNGYYNIN